MAISQIVSDSLAVNAVSSSAIANGSILAAHVANGAIGSAHHDVSANGTGAVPVPSGTTAQRPAGANGYFRYNTTTASYEGYASGAWGSIGGSSGPSAFITGSNNSLITANNTITQNVFIANNTGALAIGPLIIANGAFLTMNANSRLVIL